MSKRNDNKGPLLPLTTDDIIGDDSTIQNSILNPQLDNISMASSMPSQISLPSLSTYAQRQSHRTRVKKIRDNFNSRVKIPKYFKRLLIFKSLDFETAFWEMMNLIYNPKRVYKSLYYQKQTKNKWARDDPSFVLILCFFLTISAVFWGIMYSSNITGVFKLILYMVIVDFLLIGLVISTIGWIIANKFFLLPEAKISSSSPSSLSSSNDSSNILSLLNKYLTFNSLLEWSYCFDVHCNAYLIIWISLYLIQFFLIPLLRMNNIISTIIGNTLYLIALSYYSIITFYGYNALPFLHRTEFLLLPIIAFVMIWVILNITGINLANVMSNSYFN